MGGKTFKIQIKWYFKNISKLLREINQYWLNRLFNKQQSAAKRLHCKKTVPTKCWICLNYIILALFKSLFNGWFNYIRVVMISCIHLLSKLNQLFRTLCCKLNILLLDQREGLGPAIPTHKYPCWLLISIRDTVMFCFVLFKGESLDCIAVKPYANSKSYTEKLTLGLG